MRVWSLLALLLMAALAGCAGDPEVAEPTTTADDVVEDTTTPEAEVDDEG